MLRLHHPVLVSDAGEIIAGHSRVMAAKLIDMTEVPTLRLSHPIEADEAYRQITLREGDQPVALSTVNVVYRSLPSRG